MKNLSFLLAFGLVFSSLAGCAPQARQADTKASALPSRQLKAEIPPGIPFK